VVRSIGVLRALNASIEGFGQALHLGSERRVRERLRRNLGLAICTIPKSLRTLGHHQALRELAQARVREGFSS
jgi:hypothetical protein